MSFYEEEILREEAPDAPGAEDWIKKHKSEFKRLYGSNWARVLYGKAWLLYGKNAKNGASHYAKSEASHVVTITTEPVESGGMPAKKVTQQTLPGGALDVQRGGEANPMTAKKSKSIQAEVMTEATTSFVPPADVIAAAKRGLELRKEHKRGGWDSKTAHANGIGSGVVRAQTLAAGKGVSLETLQRMRSFFQRHDGERERAARQNDETSAANIAWLLWGGDPGRKWVNELLAKKAKTDY
jgi:hypothetical protein